MNVSGIIHALSCLVRPSRLLPTLVVDEFCDIPYDISKAIAHARHHDVHESQHNATSIKALVIDKDNCFAEPLSVDICEKYKERWIRLKKEFPGHRILIVSNSAGTKDDAALEESQILEDKLRTKVLVHDTKKPGCHGQVMEYLMQHNSDVQHPSQVAVIGDRLFTDVLMANLMGAHSIWLRRGAVENFGLLTWAERGLYSRLNQWKR